MSFLTTSFPPYFMSLMTGCPISLAMNPNALISQLPEVSVEVRISKTGMAMPEPGDFISAPQTVKVGTSNIRLIVDQVRQ